MSVHPIWQRILNAIARREAALDAKGKSRGPTCEERLERIRAGNRTIAERNDVQREAQQAERRWVQR